MSHFVNDQLYEAKRVEIDMWLTSIGFGIDDIEKDEVGYFVWRPRKNCINEFDTCEPEQRCDCKFKEYLPSNLQHL